MPSVSLTQLPKLVTDKGYEFLAREYTETDEVWRQFVPGEKVLSPSDTSDPGFGHRASAAIVSLDMEEYSFGEAIQTGSAHEGYTFQLGIKRSGTAISIPEELADSPDAERVIMNRVIDFSRNAMKAAKRYRNDYILGMLQSGRLSAGDTDYFDASYVNTSDANRGFTYDGKPWFAASGNAHPLKHATNSGDQGVNLLPSTALTAANLDVARIAMTKTNAVDERGKRI